ncbi:amidohydrolase 3, partial [Cystobasidium minutum MCA 4210]|uniref:amidohydrolase 3 n=1 Tax=Cystobasidium minutum MCA 4210 TaxID=1397322 RepID=UPI0034CF7B2C
SMPAPSMVDNHVHFSVWARARTRVSLSECNSITSVVQALQEALSQRDASKAKDPLVGKGLFIGQWPEEDVPKMNKRILDENLPSDVPIFVILNDLHSSFCNSAGLKLLDYDAENHTGLFLEQDAFKAAVKLDAMDADRMEDIIREACIDAAKKGVTEIVDLDMDHNIGNWQKRLKKGMTQLRVHCGMYEQHVNDAISAGLKSGDAIPEGEGLLTVGPYKIIPDGSLGTRTACCHHAYPSPPAHYGMIVYSEEKLKSMFETAVSNDLQLAVHAIGDKTNTVVLELLAGLQKKPLAGSTIEHAQLLRLEDVKHFSDLGLAASIQPQHMNDDRELIERFWPGRTDRAYMFKTLHEAGVELRLGSDAPVAPLDPWVALAAAVWRARPTDDTDTYSWHPEQKLSMEIAYQASTSGRRISIKEGDVADLCVLPVDPLQATSKQIWEMKVKATLLAGKFTHREL